VALVLLDPPDMALTSIARASHPSPPAGWLAAGPLPMHGPTAGTGKGRAGSRALPPPPLASTEKGQWGPAKTTSGTG